MLSKYVDCRGDVRYMYLFIYLFIESPFRTPVVKKSKFSCTTASSDLEICYKVDEVI